MRLRYLEAGGGYASLAQLPEVAPDAVGALDASRIRVWLLEAKDVEEAYPGICALRQNRSPAVYLRPIVLCLENDQGPQELLNAADGSSLIEGLTAEILAKTLSRFDSINLWIERAQQLAEKKDTSIAVKYLRFIASRGRAFAPMKTTRYNTGFIFPEFLPFLKKDDTADLQATLDFLLQQRVVRGDFITRAHHCSQCDCAFLNFKESCPDCGSDDLQLDELVHHFRCGHIGELKEYREGGELSCPKCERSLHQIGVDYDKPSIVYQCRSCSHSFQDPQVMTTCFNCGHTTAPENLSVRDVMSYSITAIGSNAAEYGFETLFSNLLEVELKLYSPKTFREILQLEVARIERYKRSQSCLALINFDLEKLYLELGARAEETFAELSAVFSSVLRNSDVISAQTESLFLLLMTETTEQQAQLAMKRLTEGIVALMQTNMHYEVKLQVAFHNIDAQLNLDQTLEDFLQTHAV